MVETTLEIANGIGFRRPREFAGVRLWYADHHSVDPKRYKHRDPMNAFVQIRLYRWFSALESDHAQQVVKDWLCQHLFADTPLVKKQRVGRIVQMCVQYPTNFQQNPSEATGGRNLQLWRWGHHLDMVYGLEYLMLNWVPYYSDVSTAEEYESELAIFRDASNSDDMEFYAYMCEKFRG